MPVVQNGRREKEVYEVGLIGEPSGPVETRHATAAERAAWIREPLPDLPSPMPPTRRMAEDELIDAYRATEPAAGDVPEDEEEEPDMDSPAPDPVAVALNDVNEASLAAIEAYSDAAIARGRLQLAQESLAAAFGRLSAARAGLELLNVPVADVDTPRTIDITTIPTAEPKPEPKRRRPGGAAERAETVEARGQRVLEVLDRHGGNTKAAGDELGMRGNVVARIASAARARATSAS